MERETVCKGHRQISSLLYALHIWRERNLKKFQKRSRTTEVPAEHIISKVRIQLSKLIKDLKDTTKCRIICDYLRVNPNWRNQAQTFYC